LAKQLVQVDYKIYQKTILRLLNWQACKYQETEGLDLVPERYSWYHQNRLFKTIPMVPYSFMYVHSFCFKFCIPRDRFFIFEINVAFCKSWRRLSMEYCLQRGILSVKYFLRYMAWKLWILINFFEIQMRRKWHSLFSFFWSIWDKLWSWFSGYNN
jgi:hypothetical protein